MEYKYEYHPIFHGYIVHIYHHGLYFIWILHIYHPVSSCIYIYIYMYYIYIVWDISWSIIKISRGRCTSIVTMRSWRSCDLAWTPVFETWWIQQETWGISLDFTRVVKIYIYIYILLYICMYRYIYIYIYIHVDRHTYIYIICVGDITIVELRMLHRWIPWDDLIDPNEWRFPKPAGEVFFENGQISWG